MARGFRMISICRAVSVQMQEEPSEEAMADMFADIYHSPTKQVG